MISREPAHDCAGPSQQCWTYPTKWFYSLERRD